MNEFEGSPTPPPRSSIFDRGGFTPEEIAATVYPTLTLAQVYAALAYCEDHRAEIECAVADEARAIEQFRRDHPELVRDQSSRKD